MAYGLWSLAGGGLWSVVCGLWSVVCGLWSVVCGLWSVVCGLWLVVCCWWSVVCGLWSVVLACGVLLYGRCSVVGGLRSVVYSLWFVVRGLWLVVCGIMSACPANTLFRRRSGNLFQQRSSGVLVAAGMPLERRRNKLPERRRNNYFLGYQPQTTNHKPLTRDHQP